MPQIKPPKPIDPAKYGLTPEQWEEIPETDKEKLTGLEWKTKPCAICGKHCTVLQGHQGKTWCMKHGGTWKVGEDG